MAISTLSGLMQNIRHAAFNNETVSIGGGLFTPSELKAAHAEYETMAKTVTVDIEVTDTFSGEANYSWVRRYELTFVDGLSKLALMRRVKALIGWNGMRCNVSDFGDSWDIRPVGVCNVCFVTYRH